MNALKNLELPVSKVIPTLLTQDTTPGLFIPYGADPIIVIKWDQAVHLIHLTGEHSYQYGDLGIGHRVRGVLISDVEFIVDAQSAYNHNQSAARAGALIVAEGKIFLNSIRAGDPFRNEPHAAPLWGEFQCASGQEAAAFSRWALAFRERDELRIFKWFEANEPR